MGAAWLYLIVATFLALCCHWSGANWWKEDRANTNPGLSRPCDTELGGIWKGRSSHGHLLQSLKRKSTYDAGLLESIGIGSKLLRKERLLVAGTGELRSYKWNSWGNELVSGVMSPLQDSPHSPGLQCYIYWTLIDPGWRDNLGNFLHHLFHHWFLCD